VKKPQLLRQHLVAAVPALDKDPERLLIYVDGGGLAAGFAAGLSFEYRYTLDLVLTDYAGSPESVMVPLLQWLTRHQPELLSNAAKRGELRFEVDVLAGDLVDLSIKIPLTERVIIRQDDEGLWQLAHAPEPPPEYEHRHTLAGGEVYDAGALVARLPEIVG